MTNKKVRTRFAPSPTGFLHIGGARTTLYNWLFARHHKGEFVLRIEDTDEVRSTEDSVTAILRSIEWMGMDWDEGPVDNVKSKGPYSPYFQMQRTQTYNQYFEKLIKDGKAYECFCTKDELDAAVSQLQRAAAQSGCETRLLLGQQARSFTAAALPLARKVH